MGQDGAKIVQDRGNTFFATIFWLVRASKAVFNTVGFAMFCFNFLKISVEMSQGAPQRCEERPKMSEKRRKLSEHRFRDARWAKMAPRWAKMPPGWANVFKIFGISGPRCTHGVPSRALRASGASAASSTREGAMRVLPPSHPTKDNKRRICL